MSITASIIYDPVSKQWEKVVSEARTTNEENFDFKDSSHEEGQDEEFDLEPSETITSDEVCNFISKLINFLKTFQLLGMVPNKGC